MSLLIEETFESGTTYTWRLGAGWLITPVSTGQVLGVTNSSEPTTFVYDNLLNVALESRLLLESGMARFSIRQTSDGAYSLLLDVNGQLALFWRDQLIGSATLPTFDATLWHTVRIAAVDGLVRITIDGVEWLALPDVSNGLPGTVSFANAGGTMKVDDLRIFLSSAELVALTAKAQVTPTPSPIPLPSLPQATPIGGGGISTMSATNFDCIRDNATTYIDKEFAYIAPGDADGICEAVEYNDTVLTNPLYPYVSYPVFLDTGTYTLQRTLVIDRSVSFYGRKVDLTILTQNSNPSVMAGILTINNNASVHFEDFTFSGGRATNVATSSLSGGAILMYNGKLSLRDMKFTNNQATSQGGAISVSSTVADPEPILMQNVIFTNNSVVQSGGYGGAISVYSSPTIRPACVRFSNNFATNGGSIYAYGGTQFDFSINGNLSRGNSFIRTNTTTTGNSRFISISNTSTFLNAQKVFWSPASTIAGFSPTYVSYGVNVANPLTADPTSRYASTNRDDYYSATAGPCQMTAPSRIPNYRTYAVFDASVSSSSRSAALGQIAIALQNTSLALAREFFSYSPPLPSYPRTESTIEAFRRTLLGNDANQIGFVFMPLVDANLAPINIPNNVNAPKKTVAPTGLVVDYRPYGRVCPFYLSLTTSGVNPSGANGGTPQNNASLLPPNVLQLLTANGMNTKFHQALIVCDSSRIDQFNARIAIYNLGIDMLFESGGTSSNVGSPVGPSYYAAFQNGGIIDTNNEIVMGQVRVRQLCQDIRYVPAYIAVPNNFPCASIITVADSVTDWAGGQRGWDSPAPVYLLSYPGGDVVRDSCTSTNPNSLHQGSIEIFNYFNQSTNNYSRTDGPNWKDNQAFEYISTSADMFLNWVYHKNSNGSSGFGNFDMRNTSVIGCNGSYPADNFNAGPLRYAFYDGVALVRAFAMIRP
jgi:predicted outer membrane repeat protein